MIDKQICDSIKNSTDEFLNSTGEATDSNILLGKDIVNWLMESPDILSRLSKNDLSFNDGIEIGLFIGLHMGRRFLKGETNA